jgi:predicted Zn-dependent peptidase
MDIFKNFNVTKQEGRLQNGIKVVLFYKQGAPIATSAILESGSKYDPEGMFGLAHFLEHMVVNGSNEFPSKDLLAEHIESVGGIYNAATGQDQILINTEIPNKEDYIRAIDIFNATLCKPLMDKKVFENEKQVILKEIQRSNSNPVQILNKTARQLFFSNTPFEHEILGAEEDILNLNYDDAVSEYKKLFDESRITFVASGDITIEEILLYLNNLNFLKGNKFFKNNDNFEFSKGKRSLDAFFDAPQTSICFGIPAPAQFSKEYLHLRLVGNVLATGRASRLTKKLRYDKGLVYSVNCGRIGGAQFGSWRIITGTTEEKVQEVIDEIVSEVNDILIYGIKESELQFSKDKELKSLKRTMQTSNDWVNFHATSEIFPENKYDINVFAEEIRKTTLEDTKNVIDQYLKPEKWQLALCGKTKAQSIEINFQYENKRKS